MRNGGNFWKKLSSIEIDGSSSFQYTIINVQKSFMMYLYKDSCETPNQKDKVS